MTSSAASADGWDLMEGFTHDGHNYHYAYRLDSASEVDLDDYLASELGLSGPSFSNLHFYGAMSAEQRSAFESELPVQQVGYFEYIDMLMGTPNSSAQLVGSKYALFLTGNIMGLYTEAEWSVNLTWNSDTPINGQHNGALLVQTSTTYTPDTPTMANMYSAPSPELDGALPVQTSTTYTPDTPTDGNMNSAPSPELGSALALLPLGALAMWRLKQKANKA